MTESILISSFENPLNYKSSWPFKTAELCRRQLGDEGWAARGLWHGVRARGHRCLGFRWALGSNDVGIAMVEWPLNLDLSIDDSPIEIVIFHMDRYVKVLEVFFLSLSHTQTYIIYNYINNMHVNVVFALTIIGGMMIPTYYSYYEKGVEPKRPLMAPWLILSVKHPGFLGRLTLAGPALADVIWFSWGIAGERCNWAKGIYIIGFI